MHKIMVSVPKRGLEFFEAKTFVVHLPMDAGFNKKKGGIFQLVAEKRTIIVEKDDKVTIDGVPVEAIYGFLAQDTEIVKGLKNHVSELEIRIDEYNKTIDELQSGNKES